MRRRIYLVCILTIYLFACKSNKKILPINEMKMVMWDMLLADNWYAQTALKDSTAQKTKKNVVLYQEVFNRNGITKEQFYTSYNYYQTHTKEMTILLDSLEAYGTRVKNKPETKLASPIKKPTISQLIKAAK